MLTCSLSMEYMERLYSYLRGRYYPHLPSRHITGRHKISLLLTSFLYAHLAISSINISTVTAATFAILIVLSVLTVLLSELSTGMTTTPAFRSVRPADGILYHDILGPATVARNMVVQVKNSCGVIKRDSDSSVQSVGVAGV